jgi:hypothetical protein
VVYFYYLKEKQRKRTIPAKNANKVSESQPELLDVLPSYS